MPYTITVDRDIGAIVMRAFGDGNRDEGLRAIAEALDLARDNGRHSVLLDIRDLAYIPTNADASVISGRLAELAGVGVRIAILAPRGAAYGVARMVGTLTALLGARVNVFEKHAEAVQWLQVPVT